MRVVVAGLGVQGYKRRKFAGSDYVAAVDPVNPEADYPALEQVPLDRYDAVLACIPDQPKLELLSWCVAHGKHVLVEKPLWGNRESDLRELERNARDRGVVIYTAYNHRFEPHYVRMRDLIASGELGKIYSCRMFYGNGTARLVRESGWFAPARYLPLLVRRHRAGVRGDGGERFREPGARPCRHRQRGAGPPP